MMVLPHNVVPNNYMVIGNYSITNNKDKEIQVTSVVQAVHPNLFDKVTILENHLGKKNLAEKSFVPQTLETKIESLNSIEAKEALDAVEKELKQRETGNADSWAWGWMNSSSSSWGLGGIWNWMTSLLSTSTETLQATREALIKKIYG